MSSHTSRWEILRGDACYPLALEDLSDPPQKLYGLGDKQVLGGKCLSIIGARKATPYGLAVASLGGRVAAECGITVVSGGALGCDSAAARSALASGGKTVVVSGCGADGIYPRSSADVFSQALEKGGAVISLEPWGAPPARWTFPKRNRVIAALSQSILICEAGRHSGTFSTALTAEEIGRNLYAVPGSIFSPESFGTNQLIADGASMICSEVDLELRISLDYGALRMVEEHVSRPKDRLLSLLIAEPMRADDIARHLGEPVVSLLAVLGDYELRGILVRLADGRYSLSQEALLSHKD